MAIYYLDSSALTKRYIQESGTLWVRSVTSSMSGNFLWLARITDVEVTSALARRRGQPGFSAAMANAALGRFRQDFAQDYRILEISPGLLRRASQLADTHALRGYDAVQLAGALDVQSRVPSLVLLSADRELNTAAMAEGLSVDDPNTHP